MALNAYQQAVVDWAVSGTGHANVNALAGTEFFSYHLFPQVVQALDALSGLTGRLTTPLTVDPTKCAEVDAVAQTMNALANKIKAKRLALNLKQEQIAEACEINIRTYRRLEQGSGANLTTLLKVFKALDMIDTIEATPLNAGVKQRAS
jgi:DNA-binding XRE family transcriptional regulator